MIRRALPILVAAALCAPRAAPAAGEVASPGAEALLAAALMAGDSPAHKAAKEQAHAELMARGPDSLRDLMGRMDTENVMVPVLAQELVDQLPAEKAVPVLRDFLAAPSTNQQRIALFYLGFYHAPELAPQVRPLLAHAKLRAAGIRALGKWQVAADLPLLGASLTDTNERVRVAAANALRDVGDPRAIAELAPALGDPVFTVRNTALRAIVSYGPAAEPALLELVASKDRTARRQAIRGLGQCGTRAALKVLKPLCADPDPAVRRDAEQACTLLEQRTAGR